MRMLSRGLIIKFCAWDIFLDGLDTCVASRLVAVEFAGAEHLPNRRLEIEHVLNGSGLVMFRRYEAALPVLTGLLLPRPSGLVLKYSTGERLVILRGCESALPASSEADLTSPRSHMLRPRASTETASISVTERRRWTVSNRLETTQAWLGMTDTRSPTSGCQSDPVRST